MTDWEKVCWCEVPHDPSCYIAQANKRASETKGGQSMSLELPGGETCFWDPNDGCDGAMHHGYDYCDHDGCECPEGVGHRSPEGIAQVEADRKAKQEADEREWAFYEAMSKHGHGGRYCFEVACNIKGEQA